MTMIMMVIKMMMRFDDVTNMQNHDGYDYYPNVTKSYSKSLYALIAIHSELHSKVFSKVFSNKLKPHQIVQQQNQGDTLE